MPNPSRRSLTLILCIATLLALPKTTKAHPAFAKPILTRTTGSLMVLSLGAGIAAQMGSDNVKAHTTKSVENELKLTRPEKVKKFLRGMVSWEILRQKGRETYHVFKLEPARAPVLASTLTPPKFAQRLKAFIQANPWIDAGILFAAIGIPGIKILINTWNAQTQQIPPPETTVEPVVGDGTITASPTPLPRLDAPKLLRTKPVGHEANPDMSLPHEDSAGHPGPVAPLEHHDTPPQEGPRSYQIAPSATPTKERSNSAGTTKRRNGQPLPRLNAFSPPPSEKPVASGPASSTDTETEDDNSVEYLQPDGKRLRQPSTTSIPTLDPQSASLPGTPSRKSVTPTRRPRTTPKPKSITPTRRPRNASLTATPAAMAQAAPAPCSPFPPAPTAARPSAEPHEARATSTRPLQFQQLSRETSRCLTKGFPLSPGDEHQETDPSQNSAAAPTDTLSSHSPAASTIALCEGRTDEVGDRPKLDAAKPSAAKKPKPSRKSTRPPQGAAASPISSQSSSQGDPLSSPPSSVAGFSPAGRGRVVQTDREKAAELKAVARITQATQRK